MTAIDGFGLYGAEEERDTDRIDINANAADAAAARRVNTLLGHLTPPIASSTDRSLRNRVSHIQADQLEANNDRLQSYVADLAQNQTTLQTYQTEVNSSPNPLPFPNLAWEAVMAGLAKENLTNQQLQDHIQEAKKNQKDIDLLLDLSTHLVSYKEDTEMPQEMKDVLAELKERGIDLWKSDEKVLSKEKIAELKSLSSSQVDKLRSNLQIVFATKIQTLIQNIGAIMESLKDIIRNNSRLISTANRLQGH